MPTFQTILIANRGEIACRIIRTARALGYRTVAVFSPVDADAPHVDMADEAVALEGNAPGRSYLDIEQLIAAAGKTGADAIHPGYGFLAESARFASACEKAGLVFIGPGVEAIDKMGNKRQAKDLMEAAGVPVIPGVRGSAQEPEALIAAAGEVGLPVMIKAAAGGGGKGMRRVADESELAEAIRSAASEAAGSFGDAELIIERALDGSRHIEIQVFADTHGNVIHLGERDCSMQRRHQKIIEECPSPAVDAELREQMGQAAVAAARAIDYVGAGTVEFLLDASGQFHFLEMNTRLQVEHPVTEMVTGLDLVAWQLMVAAGQPLPLAQDAITWQGHAIEARLYAEAPDQGFVPQTGRLLAWQPGTGQGVRVDSGVRQGQVVTPHYDPMIAKVIAIGDDRETARRRLIRSLERTRLAGLASNRGYLSRALKSLDFIAGRVTTDWVDGQDGQLEPPSLEHSRWAPAAAILAGALDGQGLHTPILGHPARLSIDDGAGAQSVPCRVSRSVGGWIVESGEISQRISRLELAGHWLTVEVAGHRRRLMLTHSSDGLWLGDETGDLHIVDQTLAPPASTESAGIGEVRIPMDGTVIEVRVSAGDKVKQGQAVLVMEAMKMETTLRAGTDGTIGDMNLEPGDSVRKGQVVTVISAADDDGD